MTAPWVCTATPIRTRPPLIDADNDWDAVQCFLRDKALSGSPHTVRAYEKECLRLFLWCRFFAFKPFSSLTREDAQNYQHFLRSPSRAFVLQTGSTYRPAPMLLPNGRINPAWRPFRKKGLSEGSVRTAIAALKSLSKFLVNADYLQRLAVHPRWVSRNGTSNRTQTRRSVKRSCGSVPKQQWMRRSMPCRITPRRNGSAPCGVATCSIFSTTWGCAWTRRSTHA